MKLLKISLLTLFLITNFLNLQAQSKIKSYAQKKGQVFDIIFLNTKPDTKKKLDNYFKTAFPVAEKMGYHPLPGRAVSGSPTQGNYHPEVMVFGYWDTLSGREKFLQEIEKTMPDFHQERRNIWSTFGLTYYELKEDLSFKIDPERFNITTAYWQKDEQSFKKFKQEWLQKSKKAGGQIEIEFVEGTSPFGYHYNPDYLVITSWENKAAFEKFYTENLKMDHSSVKHVNQFQIK
ncbi:hypothetical protein [Aquimarina algiphila]|uniref:hypothetical protein n=1 Tax=Aquimarina algiphila TaxID=2047982 RepID=UPI00232F8768|nr:hypothetical protein [Aquimarina algiphila]